MTDNRTLGVVLVASVLTSALRAQSVAYMVEDSSDLLYTLDFNAFGAGLVGGNPEPALRTQGTIVHCQVWGRDQGFAAPCNTALSDGLEYAID